MKIRSFVLRALAMLVLSACSFAGYTITKDFPATNTPAPTVTHVVTLEEQAYIECTKFVAKQGGPAMQLAVPYQPSYVVTDGSRYTVTLNYTTGPFYECKVSKNVNLWTLIYLK